MLWAKSDVDDRNAIENAQINAVKETVNYIESYVAGVKRGKDGKRKESSIAILSAIVTHFTSRELDPQLHSHTIIPNITKAKDGKLMAIDSRKIYLNQKVIGAVYRSQLARELQVLGYVLEKDNESFRVTDIVKSLESEFSTRTQQIKHALNEHGISTSASNRGDLIKLATRKSKSRVSLDQLLPLWREKISKLSLKQRSKKPKIDEQEQDISPLKRLTDKHSSFTQQQLEYEVLLDEVLSGKNIMDLRRTINTCFATREIVALTQGDYHNLYTSKKVLIAESLLIEKVHYLNSQSKHQFSEDELALAVEQFEREVSYTPSAEQIEALKSACLDSDFAIVQGSAGAGKSSVMRVLKLLSDEANKTVLGAATVKKAANNLASETGIESLTIAKILHNIEQAPDWLEQVDILVIDEAGQIPSITLLEVAIQAKKSGTKIILTGEDKQLDAITHGGSLAYLSEKFGCSRIETIQRQNDAKERQVVLNFRDGQAKKAFQYLSENNRTHFGTNAQSAIEKLVADTISFKDANKEKDFIVLASKWSQVNAISALIREHLKSVKEIKGVEYACSCSVSNHIFKQLFAVGDSIRFTRNDYRLGIVNGSSGKIKSLYANKRGELVFTVALSCGRELSFRDRDYMDDKGNVYLTYAYASTVYSSQGLTVDGDSFILWDASMHRSSTYVAGSRHKEKSHWYFNEAQLTEIETGRRVPNLNLVSSIASDIKQKKLATELKAQSNEKSPVQNTTVIRG